MPPEARVIEGMVIQVLDPNRVVLSVGTEDGVGEEMVFAVCFGRSADAAEKCRVGVILPGRYQTVCEATVHPLPNSVVPGDYVHEVVGEPPVAESGPGD
ncbi:MAG: hypothetical protein QOF51_120 [Chloroflexota bacterium]|jgi:hypothetical protein|nr:hypothetical protein [Chloroflexota bacterium]